MTESVDQQTLQVQQQPEPEIGSLIADRYRVLELLGKGGMGVVYRAEHVHIGRTVALKILLADVAKEAAAFKRFQQEARATTMLDHPNIVSVYDFGLMEESNQAYLTMDYIAGKSLETAFFETGNVLPLARFRHIFAQACDALDHAHQKGVVHRDIKPSNIMLVPKGDDPDFVKLVDFGLVKFTSLTDAEQKLTSSQTLLGSPLFMSPEQCRGLEIDHRSDIYSLACVMYRAICGSVPLMGETVLDTLYKHVSEDPIPPSKLNPDQFIPTSLERVISRAMKKKQADRQQSMAELKAELLAALPDSVLLAAPQQQKTMPLPASLAIPQATVSVVPKPAPASAALKKRQQSAAKEWALPIAVIVLVGAVVVGSILHFVHKHQQHQTAMRKLEQSMPPPVVPAVAAPAPEKADPAPSAPSDRLPLEPTKAMPEQSSFRTSRTKERGIATANRAIQEAKLCELEGDELAKDGSWRLAKAEYLKALEFRLLVNGAKSPESLRIIAKLTLTCDKMGDVTTTVEYFNKFANLFRANPVLISNDSHLLAQLTEVSEKYNSDITELLINTALSSKYHAKTPHEPALTQPLVMLAKKKALAGDQEAVVRYLRWALAVSDGVPALQNPVRLQLAAYLRYIGRYDEADHIVPLAVRPRRRAFPFRDE